jgi:hypothetical protein
MSDKKVFLKRNAPLAVFKFPKLVEPDYGTKDYPNPEGVYTTKLIFNETDPAFIKFQEMMGEFEAKAKANAEAAFAALKKPQRDKLGGPTCNPVFVPVYDDQDSPTGEFEVKVSMKASGVVKKGPRAGKKWSRKPALFDALGRPIKGSIEIWGGTEGIIAFSFDPEGYFIPATGAFGLKLQLEAVQIVTLRSGGEQTADSYGFGAQEGGFDATKYTTPSGEDEGEGGDEFDGDNHTPSADPDGASDF